MVKNFQPDWFIISPAIRGADSTARQKWNRRWISPALLGAAEARAQKAKFDVYRHYTEGRGDEAKGKAMFTTVCMTCHNVHGEGANIGPTLNGAGTMGTEGLLRSILTPNAAVESGYYRFRVETKDNDLLEGFLASQSESEIILRQPGSEDLHIRREKVRRASFTKTSMMPEGLLEAMKVEDVADLFAYLKTFEVNPTGPRLTCRSTMPPNR